MQRNDLEIATAFMAPGSDVEGLLCRAMAEALELDRVGIDDDFFVLGGDSLGAERLFLAIEEATGRRLPFATLYDHPTVRRLAEVVSISPDDRPWSAIVKLRERGAKPPLFIVPGIGGEVIGMEPLARHLDADRPVYCCHFIGLDPAHAPLQSIEQMAAAFLPEIRRMQPTGPYHLLGACFGGLVALELAQRLRAAQHEVGLLCLADTPLPGTESAAHRAREVPAGLGFVIGRAKLFARELVSHRGERIKYLRSKARRIASLVRSGALPREVKLEIAKRRVIDSNRAATRGYAPQPHAGAAIYVRSGGRPDSPSQARRGTWQKYFPSGLSMHTIDCRDSGDLFGAHASELAAIVSAALRDRGPATS